MNAIFEKNKIQSDLQLDNPPALHHKVLDYRVTEILMATMAIAGIILFRLHR